MSAKTLYRAHGFCASKTLLFFMCDFCLGSWDVVKLLTALEVCSWKATSNCRALASQRVREMVSRKAAVSLKQVSSLCNLEYTTRISGKYPLTWISFLHKIRNYFLQRNRLFWEYSSPRKQMIFSEIVQKHSLSEFLNNHLNSCTHKSCTHSLQGCLHSRKPTYVY